MTTAAAGRADMYDDPAFNYADFWQGRDYEHKAEVMAIRRLLAGRQFQHAVDVGGGYGRLSPLLAEYAERVTLTDSSAQQLALAERMLPPGCPIDKQLMTAGQLRFADASVDLVTMVRVVHHLPDPCPAFAEVARILRPGGMAVIEAANSAHVAHQLASVLHGQRIPEEPVDVRSDAARQRGAGPFLNHHPRTISRQLMAAGLEVIIMLSVSNLRHPLAARLLPERARLAAERAAQQPLARLRFGPSAFFLAQRRAPRPGSAGVHR